MCSHNSDLAFQERVRNFVRCMESEPAFRESLLQMLGDRNQSPLLDGSQSRCLVSLRVAPALQVSQAALLQILPLRTPAAASSTRRTVTPAARARCKMPRRSDHSDAIQKPTQATSPSLPRSPVSSHNYASLRSTRQDEVHIALTKGTSDCKTARRLLTLLRTSSRKSCSVIENRLLPMMRRI
jgi:hypothetical protein